MNAISRLRTAYGIVYFKKILELKMEKKKKKLI